MRQYLTLAELGEQAGLRADELAVLEQAGLLRPDRTHPSKLYRPKLVSWARKLAFLLKEGWTIAEIQVWSSTRWQEGTYAEWPPQRSAASRERASD